MMSKTTGILKTMICVMLSAAMVSLTVLAPVETAAATKDYGNGIRFDAEYYASLYPELVAIIGNDEEALLNHYLLIGILEGRTAYEGQTAEEIANLKLVFSGQTQAASQSDNKSDGNTASADTVSADNVSVPQNATATETTSEPEAPTVLGESVPASQTTASTDADDNALIEYLANALASGEMTQEEVDAILQEAYGSKSESGDATGETTEETTEATPEVTGPQKSNGLVLMYMNGTDLETNRSSATNCINEMITASASGNTRFVILAGGTAKWTHPAMQSANNGKIVSYVIENGTIRQLDEYVAGDKGSNYLKPEMITAFIKDTAERYSSDHTSMYFWDHGGGAAGGYGSNEIGGDDMNAAEVAKGIRDSGMKFESVGFDTCLMGSLEVASNFADVAKYYIGSQENESSRSWDFKTFSNYGTTEFTEFGKQLIDDYDKWTAAANSGTVGIRTLSMLDLSKVPKAQQQWNDFLTTYGSNSIGIQQMIAARARAREFDYGELAHKRAEEVDLNDFISQFESEVAQNLKETLNEVVLYKNGNKMDGVNGLSVFIPGENVWTYKKQYDNIMANNISASAAKTFDRLASVYAGQRDARMFGETWSDQKNDGIKGYYDKEKWFDPEYAAIGNQDSYSYTQVARGGVAVQSDFGLTDEELLNSELRVMMKYDGGYISLGRINNFSQTRDTKSPVFNYNGQWLHINNHPVMLYQYGENEVNGDYLTEYYTMAYVNGKLKKIHFQWDSGDKKWRRGGYIDSDSTFSSKSDETDLKAGDKIQFVYDWANADGSPRGKYGRDTWGDEFAYDPDTFSMTTQTINVEGCEVLFHGTVTDTYGKVYTTPYFAVDPETRTMTAENVNAGDFVIERKDGTLKEDWEIDDDSFLTCSYDPETKSYEAYDENTNAYNYIIADTGEISHYDTNKKFGFRYDPVQKLFFIVDAEGEITERGFTAEELARFAAKTGRDYSQFLTTLEFIMNLSETEEFTEEQSKMLAGLYNELDFLLYNIAGGGFADDPDGEDYEMFRILVELGLFDDDDDDDDDAAAYSGYIDTYADYDGSTWGSDPYASADPSDTSDDSPSSEDSGYIDDDPDYDGDTWGSDDGAEDVGDIAE